jgi:hypothetical protein
MTDPVKQLEALLIEAAKRAAYLNEAYPATAIAVSAQNRVNALRRKLKAVKGKL